MALSFLLSLSVYLLWTRVEAPGTTPTVSRSAQFGGSEGNAFDDKNDNICGIIGLKIRSGNQIDSIQVTYRLKDGSAYEAPKHGGNGGSLSSFTLADDEKLIRMEGMTNDILIDMLTFYSSYNNVYGPYGRTGRASFSVEGLEIIAFFGRAGNLLDAIGVYVSQCDLGLIGNGTSCIEKSTSSTPGPTSLTDSDLTSAVIAGIVIAVLVPLCCVGICVIVAVIAVCTGACKATSSSRSRISNVAMTTTPAATATDVTSTLAKTDFGGGKSNDPPPPPYKPYAGTTAYPTQGQAAPPPYPQADNFDSPQPGYPAEQQQPPYPTDGSELQQYPAADPQVYPPQTGGGYPPPQAAQQASYPVEAGQLPQQYPVYPPQPYPTAGYPPTKEDAAKLIVD